MPITKRCDYCGKGFTTFLSLKQRFCSHSCYSRWRSEILRGKASPSWRQKEVVCHGCETAFTAPCSENRKYCSHKCYLAHRASKLIRDTRYCNYCNEMFEVIPSSSKRFCSVSCAQRGMTRYSGRDHYLWKEKVAVECEECGTSFTVHNYRKDTARFCSHVCYANWMHICCHGENAFHWQGGYVPEPYPLAFNEIFREQIRERDNYVCAICKLWGNCVHHINYVKDDTMPQNCITLCKSCHSTTNTNRDYWERSLLSLMEARGTGQDTLLGAINVAY